MRTAAQNLRTCTHRMYGRKNAASKYPVGTTSYRNPCRTGGCTGWHAMLDMLLTHVYSKCSNWRHTCFQAQIRALHSARAHGRMHAYVCNASKCWKHVLRCETFRYRNNIQERCRGSSASQGIRKVYFTNCPPWKSSCGRSLSRYRERKKNPLVTLLRNKSF